MNIASFGGIFGLCLGGSVISLVELLYFFTLRLYSIIINGTSNKFGDSKRVSISNQVKTAEMNPKSLLQDMKAYHQQYERKPTWYKMRPSLTSIGHGGTILGRTAIHDFNKPGVQAFLKWLPSISQKYKEICILITCCFHINIELKTTTIS